MQLITITYNAVWLITVAVIGGALFSEFGGYVWHRWVAHLGLLRWLPNDFLRRRHFDHHESKDKYPPGQLRSARYQESCEITFHFLAIVLLPIIAFLIWMQFIGWLSAIALILGALLYGILVQGTLHTWYHLEDSTLKKSWLLQPRWVWKLFCWLRDCHDVHHFLRRNYFILIPLPDLIFGTFAAKTNYMNENVKGQNLFPDFDKNLVSSCQKPVFRR